MQLSKEYYQNPDVVGLAADLLGKVLYTRVGERITAGRITETEAYRAPDDRACHAWNNRRTARTEVMFHEGGRAYIYLCYGIHHLFNVVTGPAGMAHAVLVRAVEPLEGLELMHERRGIPYRPDKVPVRLTTGPGALSQALGLHTGWTGQDFAETDSPVWIEDHGFQVDPADIACGKRIGVEYAGPCAERPWRFWLRNSVFVKK